MLQGYSARLHYIQNNDFMRNKKLNLVWSEMTLGMHLSVGG